MREDVVQLLRLLGLARRAGKLAMGAEAVARLVRMGRRPLVIVARDMGSAQRKRLLRLKPVQGMLADLVEQEELSQALGRRRLTVVALDDHGFLGGIARLKIVADGIGDGAGIEAVDVDNGTGDPG